VDAREAARLLENSAGSAKLAIAMARLGVPAVEARRRLRAAAGSLRQVL
jgi:N-acetylmuramic acid 6-phosphate (MurNAc-6-P) etherase